MAYAAKTDIELKFGSAAVIVAADRDASGAADTGVIDDALDDASDEIDTYVGVKYTLPLSSTPAILTRLCCDIAMYRMSVDAGTLTDEKRLRYEDAIKWLTLLAGGKATLGEDDPSDVATSVATVSSITQSRLFTRSTLNGVL